MLERRIPGYGPANSKRPHREELLALFDQEHPGVGVLDTDTETPAAPTNMATRWAGKHGLARLFFLFVNPPLQTQALTMNNTATRTDLDTKTNPWDRFWSVATPVYNDESVATQQEPTAA